MFKDQKGQRKLLEEEHNMGISKVEKYKWSDPSRPGRFQMIDKTTLVVDHKYQRDADSEARVLKIASEFSWPVFGCLTVAVRGDRLFTVDGQHRLLAALKRSDVDKVPCMLFESEGQSQEAGLFLKVNSSRIGVKSAAKFKALLVQKDPTAVHLNDLIQSAGRTVSSANGPNTVACIALLYRLCVKVPDVLDRIWPLIVSLCRGVGMHDRIVDSLCHIERNLPDGQTLTDARWKSRLMQIGPEMILRKINDAGAFYSKGGANVWSRGVLQMLNKRLSESKKLRLRSEIEQTGTDE